MTRQGLLARSMPMTRAQIPLRSRRDEPQRAVAGGIDAAYRTADFLQPVLPG